MDTRNQKVFIKVTNFKNDFLQIEPISRNGIEYTYDLSIELSSLKFQLKEYGLNMDEDYVVNNGPHPATKAEYKIEFKGKSQVVRALHKIPGDLFNFSRLEYGSNKCENKNDLEKYKLAITLQLTSKTCFDSEISYVQQAQKIIFTKLIDDILNIHSPYLKGNSPVINQLNNDMNILSTRADPLFNNTNFMLLMASLHNAILEEKLKCTVPQSSFSNLLAKESKLLPEYEKVLNKYASHVPTLFKSTPYLNKYEPNIQNINACYQLLNPIISNINHYVHG